jgi:hypothetical protein
VFPRATLRGPNFSVSPFVPPLSVLELIRGLRGPPVDSCVAEMNDL